MDDVEKETVTDNSSLLSPKRIEEVVRVFENYYSTRTSDAYRAIVIDSGTAVFLWRLRYPLDLNSEAVSRFLHRLSIVQGLQISTPAIKSFGVDPAGCAFLLTAFEDGKLLFETQPTISEAKRIFTEAVKSVSVLHEQGIVLGDICSQTFFMKVGGQILIQGLLGPFDRETTQTSLLPAVESLQFLAPEQRNGLGVELASDVYALGVFAYRLFTGRYLYGDKPPPVGTEEGELFSLAPSSIRNEIPLWIDDIIGRCIELRPEARYQSAKQLLDDILLALGGGSPAAARGRWSSRTLIVQPETLRAIRSGQLKDTPLEEPVVKKEAKKPSPFLLLLGPAILIGVVLATAIFLFIDNTSEEKTALEQEMAMHEDAAPPELKRPMQDVIAPNVPLEVRRDALKRIAESDDAVAYVMLVSVAKNAPVPELKLIAQEVIVDRVRRFGLHRSARVLEDWFKKKNELHLDPATAQAYQPLLNACNPNFNLDRRRFSLNQAYRSEPFVTLQLSAALSLDDENQENFTPVLRQLLSAQLGRDDFEGKNIGAMILSHAALSQYFESDVEKVISTFSNEDLGWVLLELAQSNNPLLFTVASETIKRSIVPPFQSIFLGSLVQVDRSDLSQQVKLSLVRGARGEFSESDVMVFGRWISSQSESALLAVCALANDQVVALAAFDTLAARTITLDYLDRILEQIKRNYWEHRGKLVKAIGILGLSEISTDEQIQYAYDTLIPYFSLDSLITALTAANNEKLIYTAVHRFSGLIPADHLIKLLSHPSKRVRIEAVKGLKGSNELRVLQGILRSYKKEEDEEVRKLYNEVHWVTKEEQRSGLPAAPTEATTAK